MVANAASTRIWPRLILDSRVVIDQAWRNRLFLQVFHGGHDRCGIFGKSRSIEVITIYGILCLPLPGGTTNGQSTVHRRAGSPHTDVPTSTLDFTFFIRYI